jgi:[ribosomal protein S5]-alanine N-acetyltransferase
MYLDRTSLWTSDFIEMFVLQPSDVSSSYVSWLNNSVVNCYLESRFSTHEIESTRTFVEKCLIDPTTLFLGIRSLEFGHKHIGNIKLSPIDQYHKRGEVGILIGETEVWGKGIASQAISMLIEIAKKELCLRKLTAGCYASNLGSQKAFLKAGFHIECQRKDHVLLNGQPEDVFLMAYFID